MEILGIVSLVFLVAICVLVIVGIVVASISAYDMWKKSELREDLAERRQNRRARHDTSLR